MRYRGLHIVLAFLVFISSSGLVLSQHFCRGELKSTAVFAEATPCHQATAKRACPHHPPAQPTTASKKGCCDTTTDFLQMDADQLSATLLVPNLAVPVLGLLPAEFGLLLEEPSAAKSAVHYLHYKPPLLVCDVTINLQTFLC